MIKQIGIVGVGTIGSYIAYLAALSKIDVAIYDVNDTIIRRAVEKIKSDVKKLIHLGKLSQEELNPTLEKIRSRTNLSDLGNCDIIIECVIEDIKVKKDLFKHLDANSKSTTILASTTSSFSISSISTLTKKPERAIGFHLLNAENNDIVEVVKGYKTNQETTDKTIEFAKLIGKNPILVKDVPGFIFTRITYPFFNESLRIAGENIADINQIDKIVKSICGFEKGPFELLDLMGIDTALAQSQSMFEQSYYEPRFRPHYILKQMAESGLLGKKCGHGFYNYDEQ